MRRLLCIALLFTGCIENDHDSGDDDDHDAPPPNVWSAPGVTFDYATAMAQRDALPPAAPVGVGAPATLWRYVGPTNFHNSRGANIGTNDYVSGRVNALAFDPGTRGIYYAGGPGGLWKSSDFGSHWSVLSDGWD